MTGSRETAIFWSRKAFDPNQDSAPLTYVIGGSLRGDTLSLMLPSLVSLQGAARPPIPPSPVSKTNNRL